VPQAAAPTDVYGRGGALTELEERVAELLGKEAGVFVMKGVIAQLSALRVWTERSRVPRVALHPLSHIDLDEGGAYERLHGLVPARVGGTGPFTAADLDAIHEPLGAVVVELPLRRAGFRLPAWEELVRISEWCRARGVPLHVDGARLWESAPFYGRSHAEIAALADSVYVSFYKGLGGMAGCVLCGSADVVASARVWASRHGGDLYTAFPYVLAAIHGLDTQLARMDEYAERAGALAAALAAVDGVRVAPDPPHTNSFQVYLPGDRATLEDAAVEIALEERVWLFGRFAETALPGLSMAEISVGSATADLSDDEVAALLRSLIDRAADPTAMPSEGTAPTTGRRTPRGAASGRRSRAG
jgi:threonine aldolase